jgi:hypothetical protein
MTKERIYTVTWTGLAATDGQLPTNVRGEGIVDMATDAPIYIGWGDQVIFEILTASDNASTFDLHIWASEDGVNLSDTVWQADVWAALAKDKREILALTNIGPRYIKARLDVNTAVMGATKSVVLKIRIIRR